MRRRITTDGLMSAPPVGDVDLRTLTHLAVADTMPMHELADRLAVTPGRVTQIIDRLEEQGRVTRLRDERDRRVWNVGLTSQVRDAIDSYYATRSQAVHDTLAELDDTGRVAVMHFLEGLVERLAVLNEDDSGIEPRVGAELALRQQ